MTHRLSFAGACAQSLHDWLHPFAVRIETAGSIRRGLPLVGDIDLVVIPTLKEHRNLLQEVERTENLTAAEIRRKCAGKGWEIVKDGEQYLVFNAVAPASGTVIQVDIWFATTANFGSLLVCRTGSKEHNIRLCQRATELGRHWNTSKGVSVNGQLLPATTEEEIFAALDLPFVPPTDRH